MSPRLSKIPHIVFKEEEDGAFLFDPENGNLKYLNRTGRELYLLLGEPVDVGQLVASLTQRYPEAEPQQLEADITAFVDQLIESGFIAFDESHPVPPNE